VITTPVPVLAVAALLVATIAAYALFAGADFGGGMWDLLAGGDERGARPRAAIDDSVTPVWEGNHVWIIYGLVILWTAFPPAFGAIMTTLFIPLALSLLGIVLRGVGFAFRHEAESRGSQRLYGALFAAASVMTPFFLGTAVGAVATGRVPATGNGDELSSWTTPTAVVTGLLFTAACAYVAAVYLVGDCRRRGQDDLVRYFSRRAVAAGLVTGGLAAVNLVLLHGSSPYLFDRILGPALPAVATSVAAGLAALVLLRTPRTWAVRLAAALAVVGVVAGWAVAQYPWVLPRSLSLQEASAPQAALYAEFAVLGLAAVCVFPAFGWLYWLQQHGQLTEEVPVEGPDPHQPGAAGPAPAAAPAAHAPRLITAAVFAAAAAGLVRDGLARLGRRGR
jgi:cytochrome bd ubiquinol oxidase subunit II